jgi:3-oxoacyl-[acyl-carrier-protein] synthase-3
MRRCRIESLGVSLPARRILPRGSLKHSLSAGRSCLGSSRYRPGDVGVLINSGVHRDDHVCEPAIAVYIQHGLGINIEFQGRRTLSFDLHNGGCGMLNAAEVLCALLQSGELRAGMVVSAEVNSDRRPDPAYPYPASGAAMLLDLSPQAETGLGPFAFHTRDEHAGLYTSVVDLRVRRGRILMQRAAELEGLYLQMVPGVIDEVLEKEGLRREEIDRVIPAQLSADFLARLPGIAGFPKEKVADFSAPLPDTLSTSTILALHRSITLSPPQTGEKALLLAFGSGVTVGGVVYRF